MKWGRAAYLGTYVISVGSEMHNASIPNQCKQDFVKKSVELGKDLGLYQRNGFWTAMIGPTSWELPSNYKELSWARGLGKANRPHLILHP